MNTMLRIQVRVLAREANTALRGVATQITRINAASVKLNAMPDPFIAKAISAQLLNKQLVQTAALSRQIAASNVLRGARGASGAAAGASIAGVGMAASLSQGKAMTQRIGMLDRMSMAINGSVLRSSKGLLAMGKNLQWVGRQLNFNFTIPLTIAAVAATKWAFDVERAFTRVKKVYGDGLSDYTDDLAKVNRGVRLMSDYYGVAQEDVMELAAQWAAAGAEGGNLLKSVESSLNLSILGDYENLSQTFEDLIVIQSAYRLSVGETATVVALLNRAENITAASMQDLVKGLSKAGATANATGVDVRQLTAMLTALIPAVGTAEIAGTSLKTIMSRIIEPTKQATEAIAEAGFDIESMSWKSKDAAERIEALAYATEEMTDTERASIATRIAGRRQLNAFLILWDDMTDRAGRYHLVLEELAPALDKINWERANQEIATLLESDPRKFEIITTQLKNLAVEAVIPLIPVLFMVVSAFKAMLTWFNSLDPSTQRLIFGIAAATVVIAILAQAIGSIILLVGTLANGLLHLAAAALWVVSAFGGIVAAIVSPWGIAIAAILVLAYFFRDELAQIWYDIVDTAVRAFNALPQGVRGAFQALINLVAGAVRIIVGFLQKINPFHRNSPSLVDNVKAGTKIMGEEYEKLAAKMSFLGQAAKDLNDFAAATKAIRDAKTNKERDEQRTNIGSQAPGALPSLNALFVDLDRLNAQLEALEPQIKAQEAVVEKLTDAYEAADQAVRDWEASMDVTKETIRSLENEINAANSKLDDFADAPIKGMKAWEDAAFENEMAQKELRLELLKMAQAGQSFEEAQDSLARIGADIEMLRGKVATLRNAGAGAGILAPYLEEIAALEAEASGIKVAAEEFKALEDQLSELEVAAEIMDLEGSLQFDPLIKQIEDMIDTTEELTFEEIVAGIQEQQTELERLNPLLEEANAELDAQQTVLDDLNATRDAAKVAMDNEKNALKELKDEYAEIEQMIRDIEDAINDAITALDALASGGAAGGGGGAGGAGGAGGGADFDDPGIPDFSDEFDIDDVIAEWERKLNEAFAGLDPFKPFRDAWNGLVGWWTLTVVPAWQTMVDDLAGVWDDFKETDFFQDVKEAVDDFDWDTAWTSIKDSWSTLWDEAAGNIDIDWGQIGKDVEAGWNSIKNMWEPIKRIWDYVYWEWQLKTALIIGVLSWFWGEIQRIIGPWVEYFSRNLRAVLRIIEGFVQLVGGLLSGDWDMAWEGAKNVLGGAKDWMISQVFLLWEGILWWWNLGVGLVTGAWDLMWEEVSIKWNWLNDNIIQPIWKLIYAIIAPWEHMYAVLVGNSIVPDTIDEIVRLFATLPTEILGALGQFVLDVISEFVTMHTDAWAEIEEFGGEMETFFTELPGKIPGWIGDVGELLKQKGEDIVGGLWDGVLFQYDFFVKPWFEDLDEKILTAIGDLYEFFKDEGGAILSGLWAGATTFWDTGMFQGWLTTTAGRILGGLMPAASLVLVAGAMIVQGLWNGMNSMRGWIIRQAAGLAVAIIEAVLDPFDILSPSKLMFKNGRYIVQGLGLGMAAEAEAAAKAGDLAAQSVISAITNRTRSLTAMQLTRPGTSVYDGAPQAPKTYYINGDLSFPNITDGNDAESFITNLESLSAGGK